MKTGVILVSLLISQTLALSRANATSPGYYSPEAVQSIVTDMTVYADQDDKDIVKLEDDHKELLRLAQQNAAYKVPADGLAAMTERLQSSSRRIRNNIELIKRELAHGPDLHSANQESVDALINGAITRDEIMRAQVQRDVAMINSMIRDIGKAEQSR